MCCVSYRRKRDKRIVLSSNILYWKYYTAILASRNNCIFFHSLLSICLLLQVVQLWILRNEWNWNFGLRLHKTQSQELEILQQVYGNSMAVFECHKRSKKEHKDVKDDYRSGRHQQAGQRWKSTTEAGGLQPIRTEGNGDYMSGRSSTSRTEVKIDYRSGRPAASRTEGNDDYRSGRPSTSRTEVKIDYRCGRLAASMTEWNGDYRSGSPSTRRTEAKYDLRNGRPSTSWA